MKVPGGLAFAEFRGYEGWQVVATSHSANLKLVAVILADPEMIAAYAAGIPGNGKPFPDDAIAFVVSATAGGFVRYCASPCCGFPSRCMVW